METLKSCENCNKELMLLDYESQLYIQQNDYVCVKMLRENETWDTCNPSNKFVCYCEECFKPRLDECRKRLHNK